LVSGAALSFVAPLCILVSGAAPSFILGSDAAPSFILVSGVGCSSEFYFWFGRSSEFYFWFGRSSVIYFGFGALIFDCREKMGDGVTTRRRYSSRASVVTYHASVVQSTAVKPPATWDEWSVMTYPDEPCFVRKNYPICSKEAGKEIFHQNWVEVKDTGTVTHTLQALNIYHENGGEKPTIVSPVYAYHQFALVENDMNMGFHESCVSRIRSFEIPNNGSLVINEFCKHAHISGDAMACVVDVTVERKLPFVIFWEVRAPLFRIFL
jgi:hypothetical protein